MRFLAVQEEGYGVGLVQSRLPDNADESMMAATGDTKPGKRPRVEEGSMISNLPLLFVDGYPTSLDKISLEQLERFIAFMVQCSLGHDTAAVISEPQWWPKEVKFADPLVRPKKLNDSWMANLKKLVFRCYTWHKSEYLLRFCSYLAQYPRDKLNYVNNWDKTTSLYHKSTGKLLVTFRNENMTYDKVVESPRRSLLPQHGCLPGFPGKSRQPQQQQLQQQQQQQQQRRESHSLVVIQPPSDEIYLCDNCDAEFVGLEKMKDHEKTCGEHGQSARASRSQTPNEIPLGAELAQNQFLGYFDLYSESQACKFPGAGRSKSRDPGTGMASRASRRLRNSVNLTRCPAIPFSSPAGLLMAKKSKMMTEVTQQERLDRIERRMYAPALGRSVRPKWLDRFVEYNRWVVTYKANRDEPQQEHQQHAHRYKFNSRRDRLVLSIRSQLLYMACKPIYVSVERLGPERIAELKRDPSKYSCPVGRIASRVRARPRPKSLSKIHREARSSFELLKGESSIVDGTKEASINGTTRTHRSRNDGDLRDGEDPAEISVIDNTTTRVEEPVEKSQNIVIVDLCSSDDEESETPSISSDENRDPLRMSANPNGRTSFAKAPTINKFRSKARLHPADSTSDWLRDNVLTDDNDKSGSKCHGNLVLETRARFSPIVEPAS